MLVDIVQSISGGHLLVTVVVVGKQHSERAASLGDEVHQLSVAGPQCRPPADQATMIARRQRETVQYRPLPPGARRQVLDDVTPRPLLGAVDHRLRRRSLGGGDARLTRGLVLVQVAVVRVRLARVIVVEVGNDDRNRKRDGEYAGDGAHGADQSTPRTDRRHVAVADRRHGNHRPPERVRYTAALAHVCTDTRTMLSIVRRLKLIYDLNSIK